jgi:hypothetical protein
MYIGLHVKYCYSFRILITLEFSRQIFLNTQISNLTNVCPVGTELFLADKQTDMMKLIFEFRNFANEPKPRLGGQEILYHNNGTEGSLS